MAKVLDDDVRQEVQRILEGADLEGVSERTIKDLIAIRQGNVEPSKDVMRMSPI